MILNAITAKIGIYAAIAAASAFGGYILKDKVFTSRISTKEFSHEVRTIVAEELAKLPKPEPAQGLDIDKIKGKIGKLEIKQNYYTTIDGDTLALQKIIRESIDISISKHLSDYKLKRK